MARNRSPRVRPIDVVVYVVFRVFVTAVLSLGIERAAATARLLGRLYHRLDARRRRTARENLSQAFPELDAAERERIARASAQSFALAMVESLYLRRLVGPSRGRWRIRTEGFDEVARDVGDGPVVFVTGHLGSWEVLGATLGLIGYPLHSVARQLDNPLMQRHAERERGVFGQRIVPKRGGIRQLVRVIREGGYLGLVVDQDAGKNGVFAEFFGRPASTFSTPAQLALRFGCPIVTGYCVREGNRPFELRILADRAVKADPSADREEEILRVTRRINERLEGYVRAYPEQYLWQHRRWKTQPGEPGATHARRSRRRVLETVEKQSA